MGCQRNTIQHNLWNILILFFIDYCTEIWNKQQFYACFYVQDRLISQPCFTYIYKLKCFCTVYFAWTYFYLTLHIRNSLIQILFPNELWWVKFTGLPKKDKKRTECTSNLKAVGLRHQTAYVAVNFLFQLIFIFLLFWGYGNVC